MMVLKARKVIRDQREIRATKVLKETKVLRETKAHHVLPVGIKPTPPLTHLVQVLVTAATSQYHDLCICGHAFNGSGQPVTMPPVYYHRRMHIQCFQVFCQVHLRRIIEVGIRIQGLIGVHIYIAF